MSWIESHQALRDHPKTRKLARRIGGDYSLPAAIGILHCLWWWCLDYAPDGNLSRHDHEDIAVACEWPGEPKELVDMLVAAGFLDRDGRHLSVHDWAVYGERLLLQRQANRDRAMKSYKRRKKDPKEASYPQGSASSLRADSAKSTGLPTDLHTDKEHARGREAGAGAPPARTISGANSYCKCGGAYDWDGDGTGNKHCLACGAKVPAPGGLSLPATDAAPACTPDTDPKPLADCLPPFAGPMPKAGEEGAA